MRNGFMDILPGIGYDPIKQELFIDVKKVTDCTDPEFTEINFSCVVIQTIALWKRKFPHRPVRVYTIKGDAE